MAATGKQLNVVVVTPEKAVLDEGAELVVLPMFDGERGVQYGHSAFVGQLGPGTLKLTNGNTAKKYFIDGGFVQVAKNVVNVLTGKAVAAESINADVIKKAQATAEAMPETNAIEKASRDKALAKVKIMSRIGGLS
jgi:F-type H+-transporting ATPase subunit epsilon